MLEVFIGAIVILCLIGWWSTYKARKGASPLQIALMIVLAPLTAILVILMAIAATGRKIKVPAS